MSKSDPLNLKELIKSVPNDQELGNKVRDIINNESPVDITGLSNLHYKGVKISSYHFEMILFNMLNHN